MKRTPDIQSAHYHRDASHYTVLQIYCQPGIFNALVR